MDEIVLRKAAIIERCYTRILEEYQDGRIDIKTDVLRQDSILLNLQRMLQAAIDMGQHIVRINKIGPPKDTREIFLQLEEKGLIDTHLKISLQKMVGFRNLAIHEYDKLNLEIVEKIIKYGTKDILTFSSLMVKSH